jgi:subtilisin-like proprotein convertase family protein
MKKFLLSVIFSFVFSGIFSQTFTGGGGLIPDDGTPIDFSLPVSGLPNSIDTLTFGLETVCINVTHTYDSDLDIYLIAPDGTQILLSSANGGGGHDYTNTCFDNAAPTSIAAGSPPFTGTFRPQGDLGLINNNQNPNGVWRLHFQDTYPFADQGNLLSWSITFGSSPAIPHFIFSSSNLPIIVIHTATSIPDEPKIMGDMGIIYNGVSAINHLTDSFNNYNGKIGIELRGSSSQQFPKKGYGFETWDTAGVEINASLLGMPAESDWILSASYSDKTLMHNVLAYKLYRDMGRYAPRTVYCELVLNGQYVGVYMLMEKIKRDNNRVNIAHLTTLENTGVNLTGGYIIKIDKITGNGGAGWTSPYPPVVNSAGQTIYFQYEYPKPDSITPQQQTYIQQYVDSFEDALASANFADTATGYRKYCDENSFIDYFILNEISRNVDGYRLSTFLYKDKIDNPGGGKLVIGPPWDYDIAWHNAEYCDGQLTVGWAIQFGNVCGGDYWQLPTWWNRMFQDPLFRDHLKCRWNELRQNVLSDAAIMNWIDTTASYLNDGQTRNFITWPILGIYVWPNPVPIPSTYAGEITQLKNWILARLNWLDNYMPGNLNCIITGTEGSAADKSSFSIFPNPATNEFTVYDLRSTISKVEILDVLGKKVYEERLTSDIGHLTISAADFSPGIYFVRVSADATIFSSKIIISK